MPGVSEQADILRALGRLFDDERANEIEITIHEAFLAVSWMKLGNTPQQRSLQDIDLETLRNEARQLRKGGLDPAPGSLSEMLRTLGQEMANDKIEATSITEEQEGFRVSGISGGRYTQQLYRKAELKRQSEKRRAARGGRTGGSLGARLSRNP